MEIDISKLGLKKSQSKKEPKIEIIVPDKLEVSKNPESIIESILSEPPIYFTKCSGPKYYTPLFKENFLDEFINELDKQRVRQNLGIYSKEELDGALSKSELNLKKYVDSIKYVDSYDIGKILYDIPLNLFKL